MKEITKESAYILADSGRIDADEALKRVQVALEFLWEDKGVSIHQKLAGPYDYEELLGTLLAAEAQLKEIPRLEAEVERLTDENWDLKADAEIR